MNTIKIHAFDSKAFAFRPAVEKLMGITDLEALHQKEGSPTKVLTGLTDNKTIWHDRFYDKLDGSELMAIYDRFLLKFIRPLFKEKLVVQAKPTLRIHWVGNLGVNEFHKDVKYNHPPHEVNYWLPVTDAFGNNTIWIESQPDKKDHHPQRVNYGEVLEFPGGELEHGNKINDTNLTRVSFDFRAIPISLWKEPETPMAGLGYGKLRKIGHYYRLLD